MIVKRGKGDYPKIFRPHRPSELCGQIEIKRLLANSLKKNRVAHAYLFYGPSGTGKTSCARILGMGLLCEKGPTSVPCIKCDTCKRIRNGSPMDFYELNNADMTKIDDMRKFRSQFSSSPFYGRYKIFVFDECHQMSKDTQNMLLKEVEDTHPGNYFIFCSTEFDKIIEPLRNRCMPIEFKTVERDEIRRLIVDVCKWERIRYQDDVLDSIVEKAKGMPRNALTLLQKFVEMEKVEKLKVGKVQSLDREDGTNILIVAPHGVYHDDDNSDLLSKQLADHLDGYAVINTKYQKPETVGLTKPDIKNNLANLSRWEHVNDDQIKKEFLDPLLEFRDKIKKDHGEGLIIQIHGISDDHIRNVSNIMPGYKTKPESLHILIGYGQGSEQLTADEDQIIKPLIACLKRKGINAAIAPTTPIIGSDGKEKSYCGSSPKRLNQNLFVSDSGIQCIQLEIKKSGIRENEHQVYKAAKLLSEALSELISETWNDIAGKLQADAETNNQTLPAETQPVSNSGNEKGKIDDTKPFGGRPCQVEIRKIADLRPHPLNREIYGDPNPDDDLKISIQKNGILTPLIIIGDDTIVSGHRRFSGAKECGIEEVPVIILPSCDDLDIEENLIVANIQRQKTNEQIAREYEKLKKIEGEKSKKRMSLAGGDRKSEGYKKSPTQNSAEPISKGESRKKASARLGISHDKAEKALKVVNSVDELKAEGKTEHAQKLLDTLNNKSVNSAYNNVKAISENPEILTQNTKPTFNKTTESIEWATWTWNPITGCKVGCKYCYARNMTKRFPDKFPKGFEPTFYPKRLEAPANTSVPKSNHIGDRNVFVVSMGDLFGDWVEQEWIDAVFDAVRTYPQWNYLFLTKNPKRLMNIEWPDNAWVGTTVDCQARVKPAEEAFEKIKAKIKFLSCEPLSEEINITNLNLFDWVIIGARSKTTEVPEMQPKSEWVKSLMLQAWDAGCKVYCKPNLKAGVKEYPISEPVA